MTLIKDFIFNQSNLQDYVECQRRFQLRHIHHLAWPAVEAEPFLALERMMDQGSWFHQIVHQHLAGIPESQLEQTIGDDEVMETWWMNFIHSLRDGYLSRTFSNDVDVKYFPEITLSTTLGGFRLIAKYDLVIYKSDGSIFIIDWKTSKTHPKRIWLSERIQTHVYPYVLIQASASITGNDLIDPNKVEMAYWFTNQPEQPEIFRYNNQVAESDRKLLVNLIASICQKSEPVFPLTPDERHCLFCSYRSLCNRGIKPGDINDIEEWQGSSVPEDISLDFEQIVEIEF
jgi:CRISPR/Cas system-associated exonuclease Cas4 (RecB family)